MTEKHEPNRYEFEIYLDKPAGWAWLARHQGRAIVLSTGHKDEFDARRDLDRFKRTAKL